MHEHNKKWVSVLFIIGLLVLWELLFQVGLIDAVRVSHPIAILETVKDSNFLRGWGIMSAQVGLASLIGISIGLLFGRLIIRSVPLTEAALAFLQIGQWLPFLLYWPLPIWPPRPQYWLDAFFWILVGSITAVSLSTCYHYLATIFLLRSGWHQARSSVIRMSILQALFISVISQIWLRDYDWLSFFGPRPGGVEIGYASICLLVTSILIVNRAFRSNFDQISRDRATILVKEVATSSWISTLGSGLFWLVCLILWYLLSVPLKKYLFVSPPLDVLRAGYSLLSPGASMSTMDSAVWKHIGVSLLEMAGGLVLAGGGALLLSRILRANDELRNRLMPLLPFSNIAPILLPLFLLNWAFLKGSIHTLAVVASVSFFPLVQAFWGLRDRPLAGQLFLAVNEALPYAFVAMLFGEAMNATAGVGFLMLFANLKAQTIATGISVSLMTVALLIILSSAIRWVVKRFYFFDQGQVEVAGSQAQLS